jgi:ribosomal protein L21E
MAEQYQEGQYVEVVANHAISNGGTLVGETGQVVQVDQTLDSDSLGVEVRLDSDGDTTWFQDDELAPKVSM